ncbi:aspartate kinase [Flavobacteriales bacterium]|nr:aspartate kinase [Flavobacteriales bacterium]
MKVFKFGGASVKNSDSIRNIVEIIRSYGSNELIIVVSAMDKTTNALENVLELYLKKNKEYLQKIDQIFIFHDKICRDLFPKNHNVFSGLKNIITKLASFLKNNKSPNYSFVYDQTVSYGELISTFIINSYFIEEKLKINFIDARNCIKTDSNYRGGNIIWDKTNENIRDNIKINQLNLTQGFIASDKNNFNVTLGREGSDYSAAIFAFAVNAESLTIWKDVKGLLNGDPKYFKNTELIKTISYSEAIELAFYGASVIHPKTLQPLQKKEIPLYVKSFEKPDHNGTEINKNLELSPKVPCYIFKNKMIFIKIFSLDFSFAIDENLSNIFEKIDECKMKVDVIQNSAISFSICLYDKYDQIDNLLKNLKEKFKIEVFKNTSLYTIRHFDEKSIKVVSEGKKLLLEQRTEKTVKLIFSA